MDQNQTPYQRQSVLSIGRMKTFVLLLAGICYAVYALVLAPIYTQLSANVAYQNGFVTVLLSYMLPLLDIVVFVGVYAATIYAIWRGGFARAYSVPLIFVALTVGKYLLNFFMTCLTDGGFPTFDSFVSDDLPLIGQSILLELLQFGLVVLVASLVRYRRVKKHQMAMLYEKHPVDERVLSFPMAKLLSYKNPVQWASFWSSVILLLGRWYMHLIYQLALIVYNGMADSWKVIVFDLVSDVLIAVVAYFVTILLLSHFDKKDMESLAKS